MYVCLIWEWISKSLNHEIVRRFLLDRTFTVAKFALYSVWKRTRVLSNEIPNFGFITKVAVISSLALVSSSDLERYKGKILNCLATWTCNNCGKIIELQIRTQTQFSARLELIAVTLELSSNNKTMYGAETWNAPTYLLQKVWAWPWILLTQHQYQYSHGQQTTGDGQEMSWMKISALRSDHGTWGLWTRPEASAIGDMLTLLQAQRLDSRHLMIKLLTITLRVVEGAVASWLVRSTPLESHGSSPVQGH